MVRRKLPLPSHHNPLLEEEHTPLAEILIERRRLGQTDLQVRASLVGTSNATKPTNLGKFDYVHLRVPLPKALDGSGIFPAGATVPIPESYFLMRRSSDGFVSGTGMFKAAFPWATKEEGESERHYIKALPDTDRMEVAGNIWITPEVAIALAKDYKITAWIEALLSEEEVVHQSTTTQEPISSPPHFTKPQPQHSMSTRKQRQDSREVSIPRETRSGSPVKSSSKAARDAAIEARPKAIPHKKRHKKSAASNAMKERGVTPSSQLDSVADSNDERDATPQHIGDADVDASQSLAETTDPLPEDTVRVIVDSKVDDDGEVQTTHTTVKVEMPANSPDLELPHDTEGVVEIAKDLLQNMKDLERVKAQGGLSAKESAEEQLRRNREDLDRAEADGTLPALQPGHKRKSPAELHQSQSPSKSKSKTQSQSASQPQSQSASQSKSNAQSKPHSQPKPSSQSLPAPAKSNKRSRDEYEEDLEGPEEIVEEVVDISAADEAEAVAGVNDEERKAAQREHRPAKRVRVMVPAEEYRREKVRGRALLGLGGAFAVGLLLPALSSFFA